jgi:hypothetical protein
MVNYGATDRCTGGTPSAQSASGSYPVGKAFDDDNATFWFSTSGGQWIQYDFGAGVAWMIGKVIIRGYADGDDGVKIEDFIIQGSNNGSSWTTLHTATHQNNENDQIYTFSNSTAYRYIRIDIDDDASGYYGTNARSGIREISMYECIYHKKGGIAIGSPWIFLKQSYERHKKLWTPEGLKLPKDLGFSY